MKGKKIATTSKNEGDTLLKEKEWGVVCLAPDIRMSTSLNHSYIHRDYIYTWMIETN